MRNITGLKSFSAAIAFSVLAGLFAGHTALAADRFDIAVTVDDLPVHGAVPQGMTRTGIAQSYLDTLKAHKVVEAYGFTNSSKITREPGSEAVLDLWRATGYPLGNHTYTHMNLGRAASLDAWIADLEAGEPEVAKRMSGKKWKVLRFPNLVAAASDPAWHDGAISYLKTHGYKIAEVTVSFDDWAYTEAYARCTVTGDQAAIATMQTQYLKQVDDGIVRMKALSTRVYGRVIPQVLLTHIGGFAAVMLPQVMDRLDAAGAHYVTLSKAQSDKAYKEVDPLAGNNTMMERSARRKGIDISDIIKMAPTTNIDAMCR
jgi:peptidoglycan/xylan/chitin deacetylase (PgdA/CDA1 family)